MAGRSVLVGCLLILTSSIAAETPTFLEAQAAAGAGEYATNCAACHGSRLEGIHLGPPLTGTRFDQSWRGKPLEMLAFHVRRMPVAAPGSLSDGAYTNILAFILQANGFAPGAELPTDSSTYASLTLPDLEDGAYDPDAPVTLSDRQQSLLRELPPVTETALNNPAAGDWLRWGRGSAGLSYSPLTQIDKENVANLRPAWRAPLRSGAGMAAPLVHRGVMFVHTFPDTVLAMDATNGEVLWRYQHEGIPRSSSKMGIGLHGDKVFVPTSNLHVVALNAKDGSVAWDHEITTPVKPEGGFRNYQLRTAPLTVGNTVIQGVTASFIPQGGFILGLDIDTGEEIWRFNTIARPGEPGGDTWNNLPLDARSGGSVWHQGTYDPDLNLVYFGIAPTYDTGPLLHELDEAGVSNSALYTNSTVALNPDTGELVWHFQHMPNGQWDLDWAFERQIVELPTADGKKKAIVNVGKMAILEAVDAATGEYLFSVDTGVQNVIAAIDPKTGAKEIDPSKLPDPARPATVCPSALGARSWPPVSFSPRTGLAYVPLLEECMLMGKEGMQLLTSGVGISDAAHPDAADGMVARLQAIDVVNRKLAWNRDQAAPISTGMLATAGGVLFAGDVEPSLKAIDDATGKLLWQTDLSQAPTSGLMTYQVDGVQYVTVMVGVANLHVGSLAGIYNEALGVVGSLGRRQAAPAEIWTFALPQAP